MEILLLPTVINFLDFITLNRFPFLCKTTASHVTRSCDGIGFWLSYSYSFSHHYGLFMRPDDGVLIKNVRKHFFDELWVAKEKWLSVNQGELSGSTHAFRIKVSCRFRPGDRGRHNMCLPLHQFLKVRRDKNKLSENTSDLLVGEEDPAEFLDPFLGSLMREPVLLLSSGKICERGIAVQCILRGGRDPFNGEKLGTEMMVYQADLSNRISAWRRKKDISDVSVGVSEVKLLIDEGAIDPELLEALMEVSKNYLTLHVFIVLWRILIVA
jgi:U-box domain